MTTRTYKDELNCEMVEKPIICIQCNGSCVIKREVPVSVMNSGGFAEIEIECPNCEGRGETFIEVCNNCQQQEDECHCLDSTEQEVRAA
ncbi:MAG TPA: hypothetical protein VF290_02545 [Pyrinomonadaceae bacterium]